MRSWRVPCGPDGRPSGPDGTEQEIAQRLVTSAENSSLDWRAQFGYIEDIDDGRGYTAGIIGFTTGTGDLLDVVTRYVQSAPGNSLEPFVPALRKAKGSGAHDGLDGLPSAWTNAASDPVFRRAQLAVRDEQYFGPAFGMATVDGLRALGRFCYCDAIVMHGPGDDRDSFGGIRAAALRAADPPAKGGDESAYLNTFLDIRRKVMRRERGHSDTSRIDTAQRVFLQSGNLDLLLPLNWSVYGDQYTITCT